jgi:hypothetical protein
MSSNISSGIIGTVMGNQVTKLVDYDDDDDDDRPGPPRRVSEVEEDGGLLKRMDGKKTSATKARPASFVFNAAGGQQIAQGQRRARCLTGACVSSII